MTNLTNMFTKFVNSNTASTSGLGTLPSNTITNPKEDLKGITTRSDVAYQGPTIPTTSSSPPKVVERKTEVTKDTVPPTNNGSTKDVQPLVVQVETLVPNSEPVVAPSWEYVSKASESFNRSEHNHPSIYQSTINVIPSSFKSSAAKIEEIVTKQMEGEEGRVERQRQQSRTTATPQKLSSEIPTNEEVDVNDYFSHGVDDRKQGSPDLMSELK
ncbi:hypothetical protein Tco_0765678 [Tanacetum coccineum]